MSRTGQESACPRLYPWVGRLPTISGSGASPADALEAAAEDTGRTVPGDEVRVAGAGRIGGLNRRIRRNPTRAVAYSLRFLPSGHSELRGVAMAGSPVSIGGSPDIRSCVLFSGPFRAQRKCNKHRGDHLYQLRAAGETKAQDSLILVLLAWQATTAGASARATRVSGASARTWSHWRQRAGRVAIFGARTGDPVSVNREAQLIVQALKMPPCPRS